MQRIRSEPIGWEQCVQKENNVGTSAHSNMASPEACDIVQILLKWQSVLRSSLSDSISRNIRWFIANNCTGFDCPNIRKQCACVRNGQNVPKCLRIVCPSAHFRAYINIRMCELGNVNSNCSPFLSFSLFHSLSTPSLSLSLSLSLYIYIYIYIWVCECVF